jgi:hypothetical protein
MINAEQSEKFRYVGLSIRDDVAFEIDGNIDGFGAVHPRAAPDALVIFFQRRHRHKACGYRAVLSLCFGKTIRARKRRADCRDRLIKDFGFAIAREVRVGQLAVDEGDLCAT